MNWKLRASEQLVEMLEDKARQHDKLVKVLGKAEVDRLIAISAQSERKRSNEMVI